VATFKIGGMAGELASVPMADVEKLLAVASDRERAAVLLAAEAGLRAGEIRGLQWGDVRDGQLTVRRSTTRRTR
jgi:integrase